MILAFRRLHSAPGWTVAAAEPLAAYNASWRRPLVALGAGGVATFLVALLAAASLGRRISRPVRTLTRRAEAVAASGGVVPVPEGVPAPVAEFESLRLSMHRADTAIRARAAEATAGEARLRAVVDTAVSTTAVIDESGTMQSFNRSAEAIFGYGAGETVGRNLSMLMGAEHGGRHDGHLAAYLRTGERKVIGADQKARVAPRFRLRTGTSLEAEPRPWRSADAAPHGRRPRPPRGDRNFRGGGGASTLAKQPGGHGMSLVLIIVLLLLLFGGGGFYGYRSGYYGGGGFGGILGLLVVVLVLYLIFGGGLRGL